MASVDFIGATRTYPKQAQPAVNALTLSVNDGELMTIVGPSGSGKSTTLRMLAGLEPCDLGEVRIGNRDVTTTQTRERNVAMVFQTFALYPHMSVAENMAFALKITKIPNSEIEARVRRAAAILDLTDVLNRLPRALSGGQRQRVAMGRAVVREPDVFLMDEPLSNLDAPLRQQMRLEILQLQKQLNATILYVTHDQTEAMTMGQRVAVMNHGVLQQCATPESIYDRPQSLFVARFMGTPRMNVWELPVDGQGARIGGGSLSMPALSRQVDKAYYGVRPEDVRIDDASTVRVSVERVEIPGAETLVYGKVMGSDDMPIAIRLAARASIAPGDTIGITVDATRVHIFDTRDESRLNN